MLPPSYTIQQEEVRLSSAAPIRVHEVTLTEKTVPPHDHEFYEIALILSGEAQHLSSLGQRSLSAGSLIVIQPGQVHAYDRIKNLHLFNTYYLSEWLLRDIHLAEEVPELTMQFLGHALFPQRVDSHPLEISLEKAPFLTSRKELRESKRLSPADPIAAVLQRAILLKCFALWHPTIQRSYAGSSAFLRHPVVQHVVDQAELSIQHGEVGDMASWAQRYQCTPDHLCRVFKTLTGDTPSAYYQRRRLQHAVLAVIHSRDTLSEIAHRYGFTDSAHFSHQFKTSYGISPRLYRKRFQDS